MVWTVCNVKEHSTPFSVSLPAIHTPFSVSLPATYTPVASDYTADPTMVTFNSGDTSQTVTVTAMGDNMIENDEMFTLSLTSADTAIDMLSPQSATVTITDQTSKYILLSVFSLYPHSHLPSLSLSLLFSGDCWV